MNWNRRTFTAWALGVLTVSVVWLAGLESWRMFGTGDAIPTVDCRITQVRGRLPVVIDGVSPFETLPVSVEGTVPVKLDEVSYDLDDVPVDISDVSTVQDLDVDPQ